MCELSALRRAHLKARSHRGGRSWHPNAEFIPKESFSTACWVSPCSDRQEHMAGAEVKRAKQFILLSSLPS